jgi:MurNAc alpha-1-phosphate uridylyltransferase
MILAAGRGERLRPLTDRVPKPLLPVAGKPLILHHLENLSRAGFEEIVVNLSWLGEQIRDLLGDGADLGLSISYSEESEALETAGGILQALPQLGERFIVVNADIFTGFDFAGLRRADNQAHLVLVNNPPHNPQGDFTLEDSKVGNRGSPRYTFSGIAQYRREFFAGLEAGKRPLAPLLRAAADRGDVSGELFTGEWTDIGTLERLQGLDEKGRA